MSTENRDVAKILRVLAHEFGNRLSPATMLIGALVCEADGESLADLRDSLASLQAVAELSNALRELSLILSEDAPDDRTLHAKFLEVVVTRLPRSETMTLLERGLSAAKPSPPTFTQAGDRS